jgi:transposase
MRTTGSENMQTTENGFYTDEHIAILKKSYVEGDPFERADAMQKLVDLGKKQVEVAAIFGLSEATVTQMLKAGKLEGKYKKAVRDSTLELDAAILLADLDTSDSLRTEIFEGCIRHRQHFIDIMAKRDFRKLKEKLVADFEAAKAKVADALGKDRTKAQKELVQAKKRKEKLADQAPPASKKAKAIAEDVREVAKFKGVKGINLSPRSKDQLVVLFETIGENEKNPLPTSASELIVEIEAYLNSYVSETQLENAFHKYCVPDSK